MRIFVQSSSASKAPSRTENTSELGENKVSIDRLQNLFTYENHTYGC